MAKSERQIQAVQCTDGIDGRDENDAVAPVVALVKEIKTGQSKATTTTTTAPTIESPTVAAVPNPNSTLLHGWRYAGVLVSLVFGLLLAVIETSITATALVRIGEYFNNPIKATWVVIAYLLSYMGFAVIFARLSDGIGRMEATVLAWILFGGASLGAGLAKSLNILVGFRVIQGIGGSGLYSMAFVVGIQITPVRLYGLFSGVIGIVFALSSVLGPILGGVITEKSTWRWIYLYNAPCSIIGVVSLLVFMPRRKSIGEGTTFSTQKMKSVDYVGALLLLAASTLLVFALQEGGSATYAWKSATIISTLAIAGISWIAFFAWICWLKIRSAKSSIQAILPLSILLSRPTGPAILVALLAGFPYFIAIINLPQRFQIVNGNSPIMAGAHLLPLLGSVAVGSGLGGAISSKKNVSAQTTIVASLLIIIACGLFSTIPNTPSIPRSVFGYQAIFGLGNGLLFSSITLMVNVASKPEDSAAAQGAISQARMLGGSVGLSAATIIFNKSLVSKLTGLVSPRELLNLQRSLATISRLPRAEQVAVVHVYADSFNEQMRICVYVSAICILAAAGTYLRNPPNYSARRE